MSDELSLTLFMGSLTMCDLLLARILLQTCKHTWTLADIKDDVKKLIKNMSEIVV